MDIQDKAFKEWFAQYENNIEYASEKIAWDAWQAKAQAVPDLGELQERIAGHQYYHDEHGHMIVDMDDVVKEISGFDSWKAQAVPEGFVLVNKGDYVELARTNRERQKVVARLTEEVKTLRDRKKYYKNKCKELPVSDDCVVVPKEPTDKTIAHMINTPIEVNLLCDHADTFLSEGEAYIAYKAMIKAQEPTND